MKLATSFSKNSRWESIFSQPQFNYEFVQNNILNKFTPMFILVSDR